MFSGPSAGGATHACDAPSAGAYSLGLPAWQADNAGFDAATLDGDGTTAITSYMLGGGTRGSGTTAQPAGAVSNPAALP